MKVALIEETKASVAFAKTKVEAMDIFKEMKKQEAKVARIEEFIRISKIQARLKDSEIRNY